MSRIAIEVEGLGKAYRIGLREERHETLMSAAVSWLKAPLRNFRKLRKLSNLGDLDNSSAIGSVAGRPCGEGEQIDPGPKSTSFPSDIFWALQNVSFSVKNGEAVGIIGRNGAGKSTLLKILSRITEPTHGRARVYGRVASLLEVGTGFHPDLTGRENAYLNGTILGMKKREIDAKFEEIVDFSGVEKFIDTPVKRYSSGMRVRLAFSVAAHLEPEILIIDEVLAVGDAEFQRKCLGKMHDVSGSGRTVLFVSHNMNALRRLCGRSVLLKNGRVFFEGETEHVIEKYLGERISHQSLGDANFQGRQGNGEALVQHLTIDNGVDDGGPIQCGKALRFRILASARSRVRGLRMHLGVYDLGGEKLLNLERPSDQNGSSWMEGIVTGSCHIEKCPLLPGKYSLNVALSDGASVLLDHVESARTFVVEAGGAEGSHSSKGSSTGRFWVEHEWNFRRG